MVRQFSKLTSSVGVALKMLAIVGLAYVFCILLFPPHAPRHPVASSETRFVEYSSNGMQIVPASCPSDPHVLGECTCPTGATASEDAEGYKILSGNLDRKVEKFTTFFCVTNTGSNNYFIPAKTQAELDQFKAVAGSLSGVRVSTKSSLLLHMNGTDGSTTFTDSAYPANTVSAFGNAQIDTAHSKFGVSSALFDGAGDYISIPDRPSFGSYDFTIDTWVMINAFPLSGVHYLFGQNDGSNATRGPTLVLSTNKKISFAGTVGGMVYHPSFANTISTSALLPNTWYHLALVRHGTNIYLFLDGILQDTLAVSGDVYNSTSVFAIGRSGGTNSSYFNGWMDEFHVRHGVAQWTASFSVPTAQYAE